MNFNNFAVQVHESNKKRGIDVSKENLGQTLLQIVSEIVESMEADRSDKKGMLNDFFQDLKLANLTIDDFNLDNSNYRLIKNRFETTIKDSFEDEIADTFLRLFDLCGALNIDIESHIKLKLAYNESREYKHGKKY